RDPNVDGEPAESRAAGSHALQVPIRLHERIRPALVAVRRSDGDAQDEGQMQGRGRRNPRMALPRHPGEGRFRPRNWARTHAPVQPGTQAEGREMTSRLESALEILRNCWCRWTDSNRRPTHYEEVALCLSAQSLSQTPLRNSTARHHVAMRSPGVLLERYALRTLPRARRSHVRLHRNVARGCRRAGHHVRRV